MNILVNTLLIKIAVFLSYSGFSALGSERPHDHEVEYKSKTIKLWVDNTGRVTRATYPGSFDPNFGEYYRNHNFLVRIVNDDGYRFVAYLKQNKQLLGVRAPQPARDPFLGPEPTDEMWHIFCGGKHFMLLVDPLTELELGITLVPQNFPRHGIRPLRTAVAGIEFYVYADHHKRIVAASLLPQ